LKKGILIWNLKKTHGVESITLVLQHLHLHLILLILQRKQVGLETAVLSVSWSCLEIRMQDKVAT